MSQVTIDSDGIVRINVEMTVDDFMPFAHACINAARQHQRKPPHIWTADEQATAAARVAVCEACEHFEDATVYRVKCGKCGCTGLSPLTGTCPAGKW